MKGAGTGYNSNAWVHCGECGYTWIFAILPMAVQDFARLGLAAACPRGCQGTVFCGKGTGGKPPAG